MEQLARPEDIVIGERVRETKPDHVENLARDIQEKGLLQPIVLTTHETKHLVAGEHRMEAIALIDTWAQELGLTGTYRFNGLELTCYHIPYVIVGDLTDEQMIEYEIAENLIRSDLTWQERTNALKRLANMSDTTPATTAAKALISGGDRRAATTIMTEVSKALIVAEHLDDPDVAKAKTANEAWTVVRNKTNKLSRDVLLLAEDAEVKLFSPHTLIHADAMVHMPDMPINTFNLIIADPPYGSGADTWTSKFVDTPHNYADDIKMASRIAHAILHYGYRLTTEEANLFMFCDPKHWNRWEEMARRIGWATWSRPLVWKKSMEGIRPWGTAGFAYTYETILYCTKGRKGLLKSVNDVIDIYKITSGRLHGAQKPEALYSYLMDISSLPGDLVLDPTCGSGTIFPAASASRLVATGIEINEEYLAVAEERRLSTSLPIKPDTDDLEDL